jgi:hypothetical protein
MFKSVYSVYDNKAKLFGQPFYAINHHVAIRDFAYAANTPDNEIGRHPTDYSLFCIGDYDDSTGILHPHNTHENLGLAASFKQE